MTGDAPQKFELSDEDRYRVSRLHEEIQGRLEELARIGARVCGFSLTPEMVRKYDPTPPKTDASPYYIEIVCPPPELGPCACIVLMTDGHHYYERPCH